MTQTKRKVLLKFFKLDEKDILTKDNGSEYVNLKLLWEWMTNKEREVD